MYWMVLNEDDHGQNFFFFWNKHLTMLLQHHKYSQYTGEVCDIESTNGDINDSWE